MHHLVIVLLIAILSNLALPANAASPGTHYAHNGSPSSGIVCDVTTKVTSKAIEPDYESQTKHKKGTSTTIGVGTG